MRRTDSPEGDSFFDDHPTGNTSPPPRPSSRIGHNDKNHDKDDKNNDEEYNYSDEEYETDISAGHDDEEQEGQEDEIRLEVPRTKLLARRTNVEPANCRDNKAFRASHGAVSRRKKQQQNGRSLHKHPAAAKSDLISPSQMHLLNLASSASSAAASPASAMLGRASAASASGEYDRYIADRVRSAKARARKERRNEARVLERELEILRDENRVLNRHLKRQELELSRVAGAQGELPTVLRAHNEEVRALKVKVKKLQESNRELSAKVDRKDAELFKMRETNKSLTSLAQNRKLDEREKLQQELEDVKDQLSHRDEENAEMRRKMSLLEKSYKQKISVERQKYANALKRLEEAERNLSKARMEVREKEKLIYRSHIYAHRLSKPNNSNNSHHLQRSTPNIPASLGANNSNKNGSTVSVASSAANGDNDDDDDTSRSDATKIISLGPCVPQVPEKGLEKVGPRSERSLKGSRDNQSNLRKDSSSSDNAANDPMAGFVQQDNLQDAQNRRSSTQRQRRDSKSQSRQISRQSSKMDSQESIGKGEGQTSRRNSRNSSVSKTSQKSGVVGDRQNSFSSTKKFFENQESQSGTPKNDKSEKTDSTEINVVLDRDASGKMSEEDKMALWMPKGMTEELATVKASRSASVTSTAGDAVKKEETTEGRNSRRSSAAAFAPHTPNGTPPSSSRMISPTKALNIISQTPPSSKMISPTKASSNIISQTPPSSKMISPTKASNISPTKASSKQMSPTTASSAIISPTKASPAIISPTKASSSAMISPTSSSPRMLDDGKKAGLLAQLNEIDKEQEKLKQEGDSIFRDEEEKGGFGYSPSFGPGPKRRESATVVTTNPNPGILANPLHNLTGDSLASSVNSVVSNINMVDDKKEGLMRELFGK